MSDSGFVDDLTIVRIMRANLARVERWHSLKDWSTLEWAGAMCGEAGEAANYAKKLKRVETDMPNHDGRVEGTFDQAALTRLYREGIAKEYADTLIYGVLMCARAGLTPHEVQQAIRDVFNAKSEEYGFPERL